MNFMGRALNSFVILSALLLTFTSLPAEQLSELCALADPNGLSVSLRQTRHRAARLSRLTESITERECCKLRLAEALGSGQMPLIEAAVCYRSLYEGANIWHNPSRPRPQHDDGESWCREVIEWTERDANFEKSPGEADALRQRLKEELQEQLDCNGEVTLPE